MRDDVYADAAQLAALGHKAELRRTFSPLYLCLGRDGFLIRRLNTTQVDAWPSFRDFECTVLIVWPWTSCRFSQVLQSWTALAASLSLALPSGGPTSVIWGESYTINQFRIERQFGWWCIRLDHRRHLQSLLGCFAGGIPFRLSYVRSTSALFHCFALLSQSRAGGQYHWVAGTSISC